MGYGYNVLVAPAVLLANPGISREEFVELLGKTHSSYFYEYRYKDAWDYYSSKTEDRLYHRGLEGLARILGLRYSKRFIEFQKPRVDENGLMLKAPELIPFGERHHYNFIVWMHEKNSFDEPLDKKLVSRKKLKEGDVWYDRFDGYDGGVVLGIIEEKGQGWESRKNPGSFSRYSYNLTIRPFRHKTRDECFKSEKDLYDKWPQFHTGFKHDWMQEKGYLTTIGMMGGDNFSWIQRNGKYYLSDETFERMPASLGCSGLLLGYVDLVMTSEAIRLKAWKVLSYKGLKHFSSFIKRFPEAALAYEKAVWDSHLSLYAKEQAMSASELLRLRITGE